MESIVNQILHQTGRKNDTSSSGISEYKMNLNETRLDGPNVGSKTPENPPEKDDTEYVEKIRSFYPKCKTRLYKYEQDFSIMLGLI